MFSAHKRIPRCHPGSPVLPVALLLSFGIACGPMDPHADEVPVESSALQGGENGGLQQSVSFNHCWTGGCGLCTGILLGPKTLLTAAHCVAPVVQSNGGMATVTGSGEDIMFDRSRIWVYDAYHHLQGGTPSEMYDVAVIGLQRTASLEVDLGDRYAMISNSRAEDGASLWLNGRMHDGVNDGHMHHAVTSLATLPASDSRYPYQLLDQAVETGVFVINGGDSGGPLFRERAGEPNDGFGGSVAPVVYGLVSRGASYARLDPVSDWIEARRSAIEYSEDLSWVSCNRDLCTIWMANDLDGQRQVLGTVPRGTRMGVFVQRGQDLVVSYPMTDRSGKVQVVQRSDFAPAYGGHGPPPSDDRAVERRYCARTSCPVYSNRDLADPDWTPIGTVPCGTRMGVFVKTGDRAVVSYPMNDRGRAVQVVPRLGGGWQSYPPSC